MAERKGKRRGGRQDELLSRISPSGKDDPKQPPLPFAGGKKTPATYNPLGKKRGKHGDPI